MWIRLYLCASYLSIALFLPRAILCSRMAFQNSQKLLTCAGCDCQDTFNHLIPSYRKEHSWVDALTKRTQHKRHCVKCEQKFRLKEWDGLAPEQKEEKGGVKYLDEHHNEFEHKRKRKGEKWVNKGKCLVQAKNEIREETNNGTCSYDCSTASLRKAAVLDHAGELAKALVEALHAGTYFEAFKAAGDRAYKDSAIAEEWQAAADAYFQNPEGDGLKDRYEAAERALDQTTDYEACAEFGEQQPDFLKALDFCDYLGPKMAVFNVCRRKTGRNRCTCGKAYPSKLWKQPAKHR